MTVSIKSLVIIATSIMPIALTESEFKSFREQPYNQFEHCSDSAMDLLDALCSNIQSLIVVQLSLNPLFWQGYSALYKTIGGNLFERKDGDSPWTIPLDMSRVPTELNGTQMGIAQLNTVFNHPNVPWSDALSVSVVDGAYGNKKFLAPLRTSESRDCGTRTK